VIPSYLFYGTVQGEQDQSVMRAYFAPGDFAQFTLPYHPLPPEPPVPPLGP